MCDCDHDNSNSSGFIFGLFIGAIISALVAVYIYKNNKTDVFEKLKKKLESYFKETPIKSPKISVTIPKDLESINITPPKAKKTTKTRKFIKG